MGDKDVFIGVDAGATKTVAIAITTEWLYVGHGFSGPGNPASIGVIDSCRNIYRAISSAIKYERELKPVFIGAGLAGWLGGAWDSNLSDCISSMLGIDRGSIEIIEDLEAAHYSAFLGGDGIIAILGTGSSFLGISRGRRIRVGGWGHLIGDEGGSWRIGIIGLRAVYRSLDGRLEPTSLVERALRRFGARDPQDLLKIIYSGGNIKSLIASFAIDIFQAAREGDRVAIRILKEEAEEIAIAYRAIADKIGVLPLAIVGSTYHANKDIWGPMIRRAIVSYVGREVEIRDPVLSQECSSLLLALSRRGLLSGDRKDLPPECLFKQRSSED
ncbi:MAG: BadF/BadG/BcrA/BcrD ATPase family protein [Sulfolobales archaeon]